MVEEILAGKKVTKQLTIRSTFSHILYYSPTKYFTMEYVIKCWGCGACFEWDDPLPYCGFCFSPVRSYVKSRMVSLMCKSCRGSYEGDEPPSLCPHCGIKWTEEQLIRF